MKDKSSGSAGTAGGAVGMKGSVVGIIGEADGPSAVFIAGRKKTYPLKRRIKNRISKWKRKRAEKKITAGTHSLEETLAYAVETYAATEADITRREYAGEKNCLKESLMRRYRPELLGALAAQEKIDVWAPEAVKRLQEQFEARRALVETIPDNEIPVDIHIYEIKIGDGRMELQMDYHWQIFCISYGGSRKSTKQMKKIAKELYLYYGVSKEDIRQKSERWHLLLVAFS